ncbi:MAG TPA: exopolysaccharide biosynthesis polyprenyl glycosylphosphotransferase [Polyangiaceae bacterium]|nr:exopolysaccharide biosynthesis polyprenyl glycosylphosphotransferase [Polyangiaceae bacterium]
MSDSLRARAGVTSVQAERSDLPPSQSGEKRAPAFYKRRRKRDNEIGQVLLRLGHITPEQLREALKIQIDSGGHVGAILRRIGACDSRAISEALIEQVRLARERGKLQHLARRARENPSIIGLHVRCSPRLVIGCLILADCFSFGLGAAALWFLAAGHLLTLTQQYSVAALIPLGVGAFSAFQLYSVTPPSPPEEIRNATVGVSLVYAACWLVAVLTRAGDISAMTHAAWLAGWLVSAGCAPVVRGIVRSKFSKRAWWGQPVLVLGAGKVGRAVVSTLQSRPQLGLKPVAILDDDPERQGTVRVAWGENDIVIEPVRDDEDEFGEELETPSTRFALEQFAEVEGIPVVGGLELAPVLAQRLRIRTAVIAMPEMDAAGVLSVIERHADGYHNVLVIPDLFNLAHFGAPTKYLGGVLGIEVQRQLLLSGPRFAKRTMDLVLATLIGIMILPILITLAILVRLDSPGRIFYPQKRLGADGVRFSALKFRTMYTDADRRLKDLLAKNAKLRAEYEEFHKLTNDPRVTKVGRFLRKYSLDELPQLWNVLVGEMSLVGPRPYLESEIPDMDQKESIILRVKPGITGIWQVTWRNQSTFEQRVQLDVEYVRSWSPWLDLYVLARTVPVVLGGTGS